MVALVVYLALGRVHVLCRLGVILQYSSAECDNLARYRVYREYHAAPETVLQASVIRGVAYSCLGYYLRVVAGRCSCPCKRVASLK